MTGHNVFKTPLRPVIMMIIGLNYILEDFGLSALVGTGIYVAAVWVECQIRRK